MSAAEVDSARLSEILAFVFQSGPGGFDGAETVLMTDGESFFHNARAPAVTRKTNKLPPEKMESKRPAARWRAAPPAGRVFWPPPPCAPDSRPMAFRCCRWCSRARARRRCCCCRSPGTCSPVRPACNCDCSATCSTAWSPSRAARSPGSGVHLQRSARPRRRLVLSSWRWVTRSASRGSAGSARSPRP